MRRRKRWTWRPWRLAGPWRFLTRVQEAEVIPNGITWTAFHGTRLRIYVRAGGWIRHLALTRPRRRGLAPELETGLICPWLSRTAGAPVLRPDAYAGAIRSLTALTVRISAAFDGLTIPLRQAADALAAFGAAVTRKGAAGVTWHNEHGDPLS